MERTRMNIKKNTPWNTINNIKKTGYNCIAIYLKTHREIIQHKLFVIYVLFYYFFFFVCCALTVHLNFVSWHCRHSCRSLSLSLQHANVQRSVIQFNANMDICEQYLLKRCTWNNWLWMHSSWECTTAFVHFHFHLYDIFIFTVENPLTTQAHLYAVVH